MVGGEVCSPKRAFQDNEKREEKEKRREKKRMGKKKRKEKYRKMRKREGGGLEQKKKKRWINRSAYFLFVLRVWHTEGKTTLTSSW